MLAVLMAEDALTAEYTRLLDDLDHIRDFLVELGDGFARPSSPE